MTKKSNKIVPDWNEVTGIMRIFGNEVGEGKNAFIKFSTSISTKDDNDDYHNYYIGLKFCKDAEEPDGEGEHFIDITKGFFSVDYWKKGKKEYSRPCIVVIENTVIE